MFDYVYHLRACQKCDMKKFQNFLIDGKPMGWVSNDLARLLSAEFPRDLMPTPQGTALSGLYNDFAKRTAFLKTATAYLAEHFQSPLRNENYAIVRKWGDTPLGEIDRAAVPWFGVRGFGVHVNGYVRRENGLYLWIGERAADREVDPGKLDTIIGGGIPIGLSLEENLYKEGHEEAGFDARLMKKAVPAGAIHYRVEKMNGLRNDTLFIYDLELTEKQVPRNTDGEVAQFHLLRADDVADIIRTTDRFKFNCNAVTIDFLVRNGIITRTDAAYTEVSAILAAMRAGV